MSTVTKALTDLRKATYHGHVWHSISFLPLMDPNPWRLQANLVHLLSVTKNLPTPPHLTKLVTRLKVTIKANLVRQATRQATQHTVTAFARTASTRAVAPQ